MPTKSKVLPFPITITESADGDDDHECPKCPPVGAPAWLATFADIATNLMAFFVLILGFANFDQPSFEKMAGSMRETFGVQVIEGDIKKETIIEMDNAPSSPQGKDVGPRSEGGPNNNGTSESAEAASEAIVKALQQAMANGEINIASDEGEVTIKLPKGSVTEDADKMAQALLTAVAGANNPESGAADTGLAPDGSDGVPPDTSAGGAASGGTTDINAGEQGAETEQQDETSGTRPGAGSSFEARVTTAKLELRLEAEIGAGSVEVERRDGKVFVTLGSGSAFASGSADLSPEALQIIEQIANVPNPEKATITVTGHTDNVPLNGSRFGDNVGLASARASAVVRELAAKTSIDPTRLTAVGRGEHEPIADNATEEGRAKNRRIEIEISFDD